MLVLFLPSRRVVLASEGCGTAARQMHRDRRVLTLSLLGSNHNTTRCRGAGAAHPVQPLRGMMSRKLHDALQWEAEDEVDCRSGSDSNGGRGLAAGA